MPELPHLKNEMATEQIPKSFLACLPWLWSHILFPGQRVRSESIRWPTFLLLLILPAAVLYPCMSFYLFEPDEGRYAQIPREMLERGEWIVPYLQSEPYLDKPPLMYWLVMISYSIFGFHDWSARLVPALAVHGCILLVYLFGCRRVGERLAFWGAMTLALTPGFSGMARLLVLDGVLAFLVTLALFSLFEAVHQKAWNWKWWLCFAVASGLGVLTKGPVILLLVIPPVWLHCQLTNRRPELNGLRAGIVFAVVLLISLPWYMAICLRSPEFASYFLWQHNVMRFFQPFDHIQPVWYYLPILLGCLLPASFLGISLVRFLLSDDPQKAAMRTPELGFLLLAGSWCVLFFSLSGCKLPTYILPAFPPLALALGMFIGVSKWRHSAWTKFGGITAYAVMVIGHFVLVPEYAEYRSPMKNADQVVELCGDENVPVVCYPRNLDSVAFYLGRDDFRTYRSKYTPQLVQYLQKHPRVVVLFGHRHSLEGLRLQLPPEIIMTRTAPMGLCDMALLEKRNRPK